MRGRRPTFGDRDAQGQRPVGDQVIRYQAEVARRAKVLEQDRLFRWPGEDEPLMMLSGSSSPIPPPTDKATTQSPSLTPATTPPEPSGDGPDRETRVAIYEQSFGDTGNPTALPPGEYYRAARRMELYEQPSQPSQTPLVLKTAMLPGAGAPSVALTIDAPLGLDVVLPAARPEVEPQKRKKAARDPVRPRTKTARARTRLGAISNQAGLIQHTKILIIALEEVLDYDPARSNQRPPALWSDDDPSYLKDVKALVVELQHLNSLLEAKRPRKREAARAVIDLARHFDKFLHAYASWLGKGAAVLTVGVIAGLLQHAGLDPTAACSAIRLPR
jgi:hypothetical protein